MIWADAISVLRQYNYCGKELIEKRQRSGPWCGDMFGRQQSCQQTTGLYHGVSGMAMKGLRDMGSDISGVLAPPSRSCEPLSMLRCVPHFFTSHPSRPWPRPHHLQAPARRFRSFPHSRYSVLPTSVVILSMSRRMCMHGVVGRCAAVRVRVLLGATARPRPCQSCVSQGVELQAVAVLMPRA